MPIASQRKKATQNLEATSGNGNADGTFLFILGFKPAWVMIKAKCKW